MNSKYEQYYTSAGTKVTVDKVEFYIQGASCTVAKVEWRVDVQADPEEGEQAYYYTCRGEIDLMDYENTAILKRSEPIGMSIQFSGKGRWKPITDMSEIVRQDEGNGEQHITATAAIFAAILCELASNNTSAIGVRQGTAHAARYWQKFHRRIVSHTLRKNAA